MKKPYRKQFKRKPKIMKRRRVGLTTINRGINPVADRYIAKLKYCERVPVSVTGGFYGDYVFRLNSLFDPNLTGTGHQPYGFDALALMYNRYRVYKVDYTIVQEPNNANTGYLTVLPNNSHNSLAASDIGYVQELPRSLTKIVSIDSPTVVTGSIYLPLLNGDPSIRYKTDDRFQAQVTESPAEIMGLHCCPMLTNTATVTLTVRLIYHCEFFDPKGMAQS